MKKIIIILFVLLLITGCYSEEDNNDFYFNIAYKGIKIAKFKVEVDNNIDEELRKELLEKVQLDFSFRFSNTDDVREVINYCFFIDNQFYIIDDALFKIILKEIYIREDGEITTVEYVGTDNNSFKSRSGGGSSRGRSRHYSAIGHSIGLGLGGASGALRGGMSGLL